MYKLLDCDVVLSLGNQDYTFEDIDTITVEDPRTKTLVRGLNGKNKVGFVASQNGDQPVALTMTLRGIDQATAKILKDTFENESRFTFSIINSSNGDSCIAQNCILGAKPIQRTISDDAETYAVDIIINTFDYKED
ncbi:MAG: hypothetical protein MJ152_04390 [Clostridia bacterium]|nr:hypothetical protein [Clostridia bacterium]